jgi:hypothetical protein
MKTSTMTKPMSALASLQPKISTRGVALHPITTGSARPARYYWPAEVIRRRRLPEASTNLSPRGTETWN